MNRPHAVRARWHAAAAAAVLAVLCLALPLRADEPFARTRVYDLQHTRLELQFDTAQRKVMGQVTHTLAPLHTTLSEVEFDAVETIQNGSGQRTTIFTVYDKYGRTVLTRDEDGYIARSTYDTATGAVLESIVDADPAAANLNAAGKFLLLNVQLFL